MARNKRKRKSSNQQSFEGKPNYKKSSSLFFIITGAVAGLVITLFASERNYLWMTAGLIIGSFLGYKLGQYLDNEEI
jgi:uncharacterized membrane protein YfcA